MKERLCLYCTAFCGQLLLKANAHFKKQFRSLKRIICVSLQERFTEQHFIMFSLCLVRMLCKFIVYLHLDRPAPGEEEEEARHNNYGFRETLQGN